MTLVAQTSPAGAFPIVLEAQVAARATALAEWLENATAELDTRLHQAGAVLFRGFELSSPAEFEEVAKSVCSLRNYVEGDSPRTRLTAKVYTSTEFPADQTISLHNELSYAHRMPDRLVFGCLDAARVGGETPVVDSRVVHDAVAPGVRERFATRGLRYVHNMHGGRGLGKSWQTTFETDDRGEVERHCRQAEVAFEWTRSGGLRTEQVRPSTRRHPLTGQHVWSNQADQWHASGLAAAARAAMQRLLREEDQPHHCTFGDRTAIPETDLENVRETCWRHAVDVRWRAGDVLVLDNVLVAHGRRPFQGTRRLLTAMGDRR